VGKTPAEVWVAMVRSGVWGGGWGGGGGGGGWVVGGGGGWGGWGGGGAGAECEKGKLGGSRGAQGKRVAGYPVRRRVGRGKTKDPGRASERRLSR